MIFTNIPCRHPRRVQPDHVWIQSHLQLWHFRFVQDKRTANTRQQLGICPLITDSWRFLGYAHACYMFTMGQSVSPSLAGMKYRYSQRSWYIILKQSTFFASYKTNTSTPYCRCKNVTPAPPPNLHGPINIGHCLSSLVKVVDIAWFAECLAFSIEIELSMIGFVLNGTYRQHPPTPTQSSTVNPHLGTPKLKDRITISFSAITWHSKPNCYQAWDFSMEFCSEGIL